MLPLISIVFISYKRFNLLSRSYRTLAAKCRYPNLELILADDGSPADVTERMRKLSFHKYIFSDENRGLGHNQNKGVRAATGDYILQLQDDWLCHGPDDFIERCLDVFQELPSVGYIRLWEKPDFSVPYDLHLLKNGVKVRVYNDSSPLNSISEHRDYVYSDRPHIKRRSYHDNLGLYREDLKMNKMEIEFCQRFERQNAIKGAWIEGYGDIFEHIGTQQTFNPSQKRENLREKLRGNRILKYAWRLYVLLRYGRGHKY